MRSRLLLSLAWLGGTLASMFVVWKGLSYDPGGEPLARDQEREQAGAALPRTATPASTATSAGSSAPTAATSTPPSAQTASAPPTAPSYTDVTYTLVGGTAAVRFSAAGVGVLWATPAAGFDVEVEPEGGGHKVEFRSGAHRSRLDVWWQDGPRHTIGERAD